VSQESTTRDREDVTTNRLVVAVHLIDPTVEAETCFMAAAERTTAGKFSDQALVVLRLPASWELKL